MTKIGIALVEARGHYLVGLRSAGKPLAGYHEFPGGKQMLPESTAETAARECREETGLVVIPREMLHQQSFEYEHGEVQLDFWLCETRCPLPDSLPEVITPWRWVPVEQLSRLQFPPANALVISLLRNHRHVLRSEY